MIHVLGGAVAGGVIDAGGARAVGGWPGHGWRRGRFQTLFLLNPLGLC